MQCLQINDNNTITGLLEHYYYWLFFEENISLIKIISLNIPKDILLIESELIILEGKIKIIDRDEIKKINYNEKYSFYLFDISQIDYESNDLTTIPNINYASILHILKFKFLKKFFYIKAGKLILGLNFTNESILHFDKFSKENFNFSFDEITKTTYILSGLPNTGKTTLHRNLLKNIIKNNLPNYDLFNSFNNENNNNYNNFVNENKNYLNFFDKTNLFIDFISLFGNCIESECRFDSTRFMRLSKVYFNKKQFGNFDNGNNQNNVNFPTNNNRNFISKIKFKHFLLEKSRILKNNSFLFHIFHIILNGLSKLFTNEGYRKKLFVAFPDYSKNFFEYYQEYKHFIINTSNELEEIYFNDSLYVFYEEKFLIFLKASQEIGFHKKILLKITNIILIILLLKNLQYERDKDGEAILNDSDSNLTMILQLMNLESEEEILLFKKKLVTREMSVGNNTVFEIKIKIEEACRIKDNFIKYLYDNLFDFIVNISNILLNSHLDALKDNFDNNTGKLNNEIKNFDKFLIKEEKIIFNQDNKENCSFVQIIECFGFDNSHDPEKNSLENLFVNYANDKINNLFFDQLILNEIKLYEDEGISNSEDFSNRFGSKFFKNSKIPKVNSSDIKSNTVDNTLKIAESDQAKNIKRKSTINRKKNIFNNENFIDNSEVDKTLKICDDDSRGLFRLIDEVALLISSNKGLIKALIDKIKSYWPDIETTHESFTLSHYGCLVKYGSTDFIFKNIENLPNELKFIAKNIFKNLFGLIIKNFKLEKEKTQKILMKRFMQEKIEDLDNDGINNIFNKASGRVSITKRISRNTIRGKTNSEKFLETINKLLLKIKKSNLKIIKLINTSQPIIVENDYIKPNDLILQVGDLKIKLLEFLFFPKNKYILDIINESDILSFEIKDKIKYLEELIKFSNCNLKEEFDIAKLLKPENFDNLILQHKYDFDNKYVMKQILSSGIMENIQLAKSGFFIRCDYITLGKKLIRFKSFFKETFNFIYEQNNFIDDKNRNLDILLQFWKPDKNLIKKISTLINIEESNFIFGKKLLFISNKALIKNENLLSCFDLTKYIIKRLFRHIIRKVCYLKSIKKNFYNILKKRKITILSRVFDKNKINWSMKKFFNNLMRISQIKVDAVVKIQKNYKKYLYVKNQIIKLQCFFKKFFIKLKNSNKRKFIYKLINHENSRFERLKILSLIKIKNISEIKFSKGEIINNRIKKYLKDKKLKSFTFILTTKLQELLNNKQKEKGISYLREFIYYIEKLIKIQSKIRRKISCNLFKILKHEKVVKLRTLGLDKLSNFIFLNKFKKLKNSILIIKDFSNLKFSKAKIIKKNYLNYKYLKNRAFEFKVKKYFNNINEIISKKRNILKAEFIKNLTYFTTALKGKENNSVIHIQKSFRKFQTRKKCFILKNEREKDLINNKLILFNEKITAFTKIFIYDSKNLLIKNLKENIIQKKKIENLNMKAQKLQSALKKFQSLNKLKSIKKYKKSFEENSINLSSKVKKLFDLNKYRKFFFNFNVLNKKIVIKNINLIKLQTFFRVLNTRKKLDMLKKQKNKERERKNYLLMNFCSTINSSLFKANIKIFFNNLIEKGNFIVLKSILIQNHIRRNNALSRLLSLKEEKIKKENNKKTSIKIIDKTLLKIRNDIFQNFFSSLKNVGNHRLQNTIKIQALLRKFASCNKALILKEIKKKEIEEKKKLDFNSGLESISNVYRISLKNIFKSLNINMKNKISTIEKLNTFSDLINIYLTNVKSIIVKNTLDNILLNFKIKRKQFLNKVNKIQKNVCCYLSKLKEKRRILIYKKSVEALNEFLSKFLIKKFHEEKSNFLMKLITQSYCIRKIILIQGNSLKFLSFKKLLKLREIQLKINSQTNKLINALENFFYQKRLIQKRDFVKNLLTTNLKIKKVIIIQKNFLRLLGWKNYHARKNEFLLEKIFCFETLMNKLNNDFTKKQIKNSFFTIINISEKLKKIIKIQAFFRLKKSEKTFIKLKLVNEKEKSENILIKKKNSLEHIIAILQKFFDSNAKNHFLKKLIENKISFYNNLNELKKNYSIKKICDFIKNLILKRCLKRYNLIRLLKISLSVINTKEKLLKYYFIYYIKNTKRLSLAYSFYEKLQEIQIYNKYLSKKYFRLISEYYLNKKTAKNILKNSFFKQYRKIAMTKIKKAIIDSLAELAKSYNSINRNKNCKVKTTQDTFSVIYSRINIVDDYMSETNTNKQTRITANPLSRSIFNKTNKDNENNTDKYRKNGRITFIKKPSSNLKSVSKNKNNNNNLKLPLNTPNKCVDPNFIITMNLNSKNKANKLSEKNGNGENNKSTLLKENKPHKDLNKNKANKYKSPFIIGKKKENIQSINASINKIASIENRNSFENFFSDSNETNIFEKENFESSIDLNLKIKKEKKLILDEKKNVLNNTGKSINSSYKQNDNKNIKNFLNADKKIQNELDSLTSELDSLLNESGNNNKITKTKNYIKNTSVNFNTTEQTENDKIDYWKLNQEYKRNAIKKIENPLDIDSRNLKNEDSLQDSTKNSEYSNKMKKFGNLSTEIDYEKISFKRICFTHFQKTKK